MTTQGLEVSDILFLSVALKEVYCLIQQTFHVILPNSA